MMRKIGFMRQVANEKRGSRPGVSVTGFLSLSFTPQKITDGLCVVKRWGARAGFVD